MGRQQAAASGKFILTVAGTSDTPETPQQNFSKTSASVERYNNCNPAVQRSAIQRDLRACEGLDAQ
jgi:hypothetical protein